MAVGEAGRGGFSRCGRTSFSMQEGRGRTDRWPLGRACAFRKQPLKRNPGLDSPPRRKCACAVSGSSNCASPPPSRPAGDPGQAEPCSAAPAPVGFVSTGRCYPGCPPHGTLRTSLRRLEVAGALVVAGGLGANLSSWRLHLGGSCPLRAETVPPPAQASHL